MGVIYFIIMVCCYFLWNKEYVYFLNELIGVAMVPIFILCVTSQIKKSHEKNRNG